MSANTDNWIESKDPMIFSEPKSSEPNEEI